MIKTDLTTFENLGREPFPWPGVLKGRSAVDRAAILVNPAAFFGDPVEVDTVVGHVDVIDEDGMITGRAPVWGKTMSDPVPDGARGFGWWNEVDQSPPLGVAETYGAETLTMDAPGFRWIVTRAVIPAPPGAVDAYFAAFGLTLVGEIEVAARLARHAIYNPDPTKLEIHRRKREMAEAIVAGAPPDVVAHDYIVEEAALLGVTPEALSATVLGKVAAIAAAGKVIELAQTSAELAVAAAKGDEENPPDEAAMRAAAHAAILAFGGE